MPLEKANIDINRRLFIKASLVLVGIFVLGKMFGLFSWPKRIASTATVVSPSVPVLPVGTKEYRNTRYGFSLQHPSELSVSTVDEGSGASTITFQNVEKGEGFQIFIVPYQAPQVSEERFKQDVPSGVRESLSDITVDGETAAAFYSTNVALGATREVWITHNGFLYEVTTLKSLDKWLGGIIQTWKFL